VLNIFDYSIKRRSKLKEYFANSFNKEEWKRDIEFTLAFGNKVGQNFIEFMELSKSQFRQDLFALIELDFKKNGFFVEFGATDGVTLSNTFLLEKHFGYTGILSEPNPRQMGDIRNKRSSFIDENCVWKETGKIFLIQICMGESEKGDQHLMLTPYH
jgi:hypothetical protein